MKLACDKCGGTGKVRDEQNHIDICTECFGLGFIEAGKEEGDPETRKRARRFYTILGIAAVILGIYYVGLYLALLAYGFSFLVTMVLFVGGHVVMFGGFMFYVLFKVLRNNGDNSRTK
ncbi:MAG TPA: hypothetical protein VJ944_01340 [Thermoplasmataceae archaeon]|nr:hypothetical protein [Thermoplasmataceae archaeon]